MYLYVKFNWDANRFLPAESKDCMKTMGMPIICWKDHEKIVN